MEKIHELNAILSDQIAAGEVVERPASVVKELVENAIDAGSTKIDILLEEAGLKSIRIIDDGSGIEPDDVETAFKRHATSKISSREDLFKVATLGFRGEALPSIASIADVTMITSNGSDVGSEIHFRGGDLIAKENAEVRAGTDIVVTDLFFNTPARLKYLKTPQTELAKITDIVNRLSLSFPNIRFSLQHDGKELLRTSGRGDLLQVISNIYGVSNARKMVKISNSNVDFQIDGFVSLPEYTRANRNYISILINGRYVRDFQISKAIVEGYGSKLMVGRYPVAVLNIKMDPILVDVNVHPTKQEVRVSEIQSLNNLISETVFEELSGKNLIPDAVKNLTSDRSPVPHVEQIKLDDTAQIQSNLVTDRDSTQSKTEEKKSTPIIISNRADLGSSMISEFRAKYKNGNRLDPMKQSSDVDTPSNKFEKEVDKERRFPRLSYVGQMHGTYLFAESDDGLYIVDQHAAQERINYEYYRVAVGEVSDDQQDMLVPIYLEYPTTDFIKIKQRQSVLESCGLFLEEFGRNTFIVRHHPVWFKAGQEEDTVREMVDYVLNDPGMTVAKFREASAIMMSCKRAIKANHNLDDKQAKQLLKDLAVAENPFNCPHGRPTLVHFSTTDMERMFKRIQDSHQTGMMEE
ncbi:DNA mismatch repair endonuclease MutL [Pediococcus claussenii]|uniref:DNA mismatch repair protein MutL n=1 Tax=Pediococcus claussenii (strain ATCC BAA-344 / DSM 14800 / JCM 18046 / KCTC 3811 / LMG 21948 / P06) TaxID=701521 RepID=G8PCL9_PEDCP|nr:DNA mismatch repair endonuclease MutL [Pediococcus claussenii]AEV95004.1 DNA mismatch repair MutL family protein [Pediococcus claussenii ATCC BAA-344]ANZ70193.1 DNA mismatch repair protein MutL [Pediococcus claussenii]ANZ72009.1 DNA mismatch repair protein MutL [Pediococcus claussenii]KRN19194.1 mutL protein [Pediococcus claussenii]